MDKTYKLYRKETKNFFYVGESNLKIMCIQKNKLTCKGWTFKGDDELDCV